MSGTDQFEQARRWLAYAQEDLDTARGLKDEEYAVPRQICFLDQQAAKKAFKAALVFFEIEFPRTHDLNLLHSLLPNNRDFQTDIATLAQLSEWAVESRYPGDWPDAVDADAESAFEIAEAIVAQVQAELTHR